MPLHVMLQSSPKVTIMRQWRCARSRKSLLPFETRPCCSSLQFQRLKTNNMSNASKPTNFAIHFAPPCDCTYRASLKSMSRKLLLQSLAKYNQTMYSPLSSSKRNLARSPISPRTQWKQYMGCLQALHRTANVSRWYL